MPPEPIVLRELEERYLSLQPSEADLLLRRHSTQIVLTPVHGSTSQWLIRPVHCCGVIALPTGRALFIEPKATIANLWRLLVTAYDLVELGEERVRLQTSGELLLSLAAIFVRRCEDIITGGLLHGYRSRADDLRALRGRLDVIASLRRPPANRHRLPCRYDEFTVDVPENRLLHWALHLVGGLRCAGRLGWLRDRVHECLAHMTMVPLVPATATDFAGLRFHSLNRHYRTPLALAELLVSSLGITHRPGRSEMPPLLLDMPSVFERFVRGLLQGELTPAGLRVRYCAHGRMLDEAGRLALLPDVLVTRRQTPACVVDAKYKLAGARSSPLDASDVYQMLAYCVAYEVSDAVLVYPEPLRGGADAAADPLTISRAGVAARIHTVGVDLSGDEKDFERECRRLCEIVSGVALPTHA